MSEANFVTGFLKRRRSNEFHPSLCSGLNSSSPNAEPVLNVSTEISSSQSLGYDSLSQKNAKYLLVEFLRKIHKDSAREINNLDKIAGRRVWY
jgi:hypothetical protein